jgi:hypothetical protein
MGMMNQNFDFRHRDEYQVIQQKIKLKIPKTTYTKTSGERNHYFLFLSMVYLYLNSDSSFLHEFAFLWTQAKLD